MFDPFRESVDPEKYLIVTYHMSSTISLKKAAYDLAIGQSMGNPNERNSWETDEMFERHSCLVLSTTLEDAKEGFVDIAFAVENTDWDGDGIAHLMCQISGGQADIDHITRSRVIDLKIPQSVRKHFHTPKYGISGLRAFNQQFDKPFMGGIVKPKTGLSPARLLEMVKQMVDGGVDFIKEDEILSNPQFCSLADRVPLISNYIQNCGRAVKYCFSINGDPHVIESRVKFIASEGGNGVHINFWSGLGVYHSIRRLDLPIYLHYQKSGDKAITHHANAFGISWYVMCQLAALAGVDSLHAGMYGGYLSDEETQLNILMKMLQTNNVIPGLSCGMHAGLVNHITEHVGNDYLANTGGAIHGHPRGTTAGCKAMRQAIDHTYGTEYDEAIKKWGLING